MPERRTRTIRTEALTRVEGEGAMYLRVRDGAVEDIELRIYEPPRFFEAFLRDRDFREPPDITSRICGICPIAYQMSACAAIEAACGAEVSEPIHALRRLIYCGEWLESLSLHVFMLHAPDFLGYESAIAMAREHPGVIESGLTIKKIGNQLIELIGGRAVHPVNVCVGGFYRAPSRRALQKMVEPLEQARELAIESVAWVSRLPFPDFETDHELVALSAPDVYPIERGRLASSCGLDIGPAEFEQHVIEEHVEHSTALHARLRERGAYQCGSLARYGLNSSKLSPLARELARDAGLGSVCRNPFQSIVVRCVEIVYALDEALRLIAAYQPPDPPRIEVVPRAGVGHGWTEAPRGMLYHSYRLDEDGTILEARIVPPTSQNQATIERDLRDILAGSLGLPDAELGLRCEQAIRNHDPCISCATHFLKLDIDRG